MAARSEALAQPADLPGIAVKASALPCFLDLEAEGPPYPSITQAVYRLVDAFGADPVESGAVDDWQAMFDVNVIGTLRVTQALLPVLSAGPGGSIVTITSTAAFVNYEGGGGYSAAKHAEHALTETLRLELAGRPVRVIEIQPGMVRTDEFAVKRYGEMRAKGRI